MEIKHKLTVTRAEVGGKEQGKEGKGLSSNDYKGPWTKPKAGRIEGGRWG